MPLFMDVHSLGDGVTMEGLAQAHQADPASQDREAHCLLANAVHQVQEGV